MESLDVSIVSGTYNRLKSLQRFVASVRHSVGDFQHYEIVLVDGGSTDGTVEWCKKQHDVRLIEHGELLGAVKAFNDGAYAAVGRYVVLANDDITFVDESIIRAVAYMDDMPTVGIGCFYQNRNGRNWHVEYMAAVMHSGEHTYVPYGQVCIVPKWLGDKVGWWGNYLRTYGGDNELSCNVLEAGYHVVPISCCCIADYEVPDELRKLNNQGGNSPTRTHPDTQAWQDKWHKDGRSGPIVAAKRKWENKIVRKTRIMYFPLFEPGNQIQRATKRGLRDALQKHGSVLQYDYMHYGLDWMFDQADAFNPDIFVFQIQNHNPFTTGVIKALKNEHQDALFVNWNGDYHPENLFDPQYMEMMQQFHLVGFVTTQIQSVYDELGIPWFYWQIGYEESDADPDENTPKYDVVFLGNGYMKERVELGKVLVGLRDRGLKVGLYGNWPQGWANGENLYDFDSGCKLYRNSKIIISDQPYPLGTGFVSNRLFQALASGGGLVMQQSFEGLTELLDLRDGIHLVEWENFDDLVQHIEWWLDHQTVAIQIAKKGTKHTLYYHSFDMRVGQMFRELYRRQLWPDYQSPF